MFLHSAKLLIKTPIKLLHGVNISCNQNRLKISKVATEHEFNLIPNINFGDMLCGKFSYFVGYAHNPSDKAEFSWMGFFSIFVSYASLKRIKWKWYCHFSK